MPSLPNLQTVLPLPRFFCMTSLSVNAKLVLILLFCLCVNICVIVLPSPTVTRSEPLVKHLQMQIMDIVVLMILVFCVITFMFSKIDLNIRYIPFNICLNTLTTSKRQNAIQTCIFTYFF